MQSLRLALGIMLLSLSSMGFSQSDAHKPDTQTLAVTRADQSAKEIILIGEVHGTQETPRLFENLVAVAAREKSKRVGVGLELPVVLQRLVDEAVKNNTTIESFREQLLAHPAWQKINDGRSSEAMLELICNTVRHAESKKLSLFFFDTETPDREEAMARVIGEHAREQRIDVTLVLTGNIHANTAPRHPGKKQIIPMGHRLEEQGFAVHSYDVGFSAGEAWLCTPTECGIHHLNGWRMKGDSPAIEAEGYDGILFVGPVHASAPAHPAVRAKEGQ